MSTKISDLFSRLTLDTWRGYEAFSADIEAANQRMFESPDTDRITEALRQWLQKFQPCLFGRIAAKLNLLSFCILTEADLVGKDAAIKEKIQDRRSEWTRAGFEGRKSGFVILAVSPKIAKTMPDDTMKQLALELCSLYLLKDVQAGVIEHDEVFLEKPGNLRTTWQWLAGVNVFLANADRRWWQDHRIPGGLAFSVNSVGHMVKSGALTALMHEADRLLGGPSESLATSKVDSLEKALELAMRTIAMASNAASGRATELLPRPVDPSQLPVPKCPVELPAFLADKNYCEYQGYYHTDVTVPSEYFLPDVKRPSNVETHILDFTYLFHEHVENPAFETMGEGRRVRGSGERSGAYSKTAKGEPVTLFIDSVPRLTQALGSSETPLRS
jgi:hypothetical protein